MSNLNEKDVISKILNENESEILKTESELNQMIDCEFSKSNKSKDYALLDELIKGAIESRGEILKFVDTDKMLGKFKVKQKNDNIKRKGRFKRWATGVVSSFLLVILFSNVYTISAYNKNAFSVFIEFIDGGGVNIDFRNEYGKINLSVSDDDPYGIIGLCNATGIKIETPHYLPKGFKLIKLDTEESDDFKYVFMRYENGEQFITFTFDTYLGGMEGIPSDKQNISEIEVNGKKAIISKEDNQMILIFLSEDNVFNMFTQDVDYSECDKIIDSIY